MPDPSDESSETPALPPEAAELWPVVYAELRRLAARQLAGEVPGGTLNATALVHEAYLRLAGGGPGSSPPGWDSRSHFFAAAAEAMRRILVDHARRRKTQKRGGSQPRAALDLDALPAP